MIQFYLNVHHFDHSCINVLCSVIGGAGYIVRKLIYPIILQKRVNKEYEIMFETGVDEMSWDDTVRLQ